LFSTSFPNFIINFDQFSFKGVDFGQINSALDAPDDSGKWAYENTEIALENPDDVVYYWYYVVIDNSGYQITEQ